MSKSLSWRATSLLGLLSLPEAHIGILSCCGVVGECREVCFLVLCKEILCNKFCLVCFHNLLVCGVVLIDASCHDDVYIWVVSAFILAFDEEGILTGSQANAGSVCSVDCGGAVVIERGKESVGCSRNDHDVVYVGCDVLEFR